jgi:hypothetical protein
MFFFSDHAVVKTLRSQTQKMLTIKSNQTTGIEGGGG